MITVNKYFTLLEKNRSQLQPEEIVHMRTFETFIRLCKKYESLISEAALSVLKEYNSKVMSLSNKNTKNSHEENVLKDFQSDFEGSNKETLDGNDNTIDSRGPTRKLTKTGYIDAAFILIILINIGFILAVTLIGG